MFLQQIHSSSFSNRSITYLVSVSWQPEQCQAWVQSHRVGLKSKQWVIGYSHNMWAIVVPAHLADRSPLQIKGFAAGFMITFCLCSHAEYLPVPRTLINRGEGSSEAPVQLLCRNFTLEPQASHCQMLINSSLASLLKVFLISISSKLHPFSFCLQTQRQRFWKCVLVKRCFLCVWMCESLHLYV